MRKCIDLESHPGFEQIQSPVLMQAIDRGLAGFSGTGVVDWGYIPPGPPTKPIRGKVPKQKLPEYKNGNHYNVVNPVRLGGDTYWDYLFNTHATPEARALVNKYPPIPIVVATGGGKFASYEGKYGTVHTGKGTAHDVGTLFHEYGHALDHMMGALTGANETFHERLAYSRGFVPDFIKEGEKMGLIFDDSAYWEYIKENGLDFRLTTRGRRYNISKGRTRQEMEALMERGDHWRIMEYLLKRVKTDVQNAENTKNPDLNKVAKAKEMRVRIEKLYDQHKNRIKVAKKISADVEKALGITRDNVSWNLQWYQAGSIADIIDALSGGELYDYQVVTKDIVLISGHGSSYFAMRRGKRGIRNHRQSEADLSKRVEIWAQFFQFSTMKDKTPYNILKKLMPQTEKKFASLLKAGYNIPVNTPEPFNQTIFNEEIPVAAEPRKFANPLTEFIFVDGEEMTRGSYIRKLNKKKKKVVKYTDERLDALQKEYAYPLENVKGGLATINPKDFLAASTQYGWDWGRDSGGAAILQSKLDVKSLSLERQTPFLIIDKIDNEFVIVGHEGRHRMQALANAGITESPVLFIFRHTIKDDAKGSGLKKEGAIEGARRYDERTNRYVPNKYNKISYSNLVDIHYGSEKELKKFHGTGDAKVRF